MGLGARLVPGAGRGGEVVVFLEVIRAVVTRFAEVLGKSPHARRERDRAAEVLRPQRNRVDPRDQAGTRRSAYAADGEGTRVADPLRGEPVEVRRGGEAVAVAAEHWAHVLAGDPEDIGTLGDALHRAKESQYGKDGRDSPENMWGVHVRSPFVRNERPSAGCADVSRARGLWLVNWGGSS